MKTFKHNGGLLLVFDANLHQIGLIVVAINLSTYFASSDRYLCGHIYTQRQIIYMQQMAYLGSSVMCVKFVLKIKNWGDGSLGESTCCEDMRAWVQISSTYVKPRVWLHMPVAPALGHRKPFMSLIIGPHWPDYPKWWTSSSVRVPVSSNEMECNLESNQGPKAALPLWTAESNASFESPFFVAWVCSQSKHLPGELALLFH